MKMKCQTTAWPLLIIHVSADVH